MEKGRRRRTLSRILSIKRNNNAEGLNESAHMDAYSDEILLYLR